MTWLTATLFSHFQNEYSQTLETVGKVLSSFEQDKKIPAYGFGAQASSTGPLPYMFALDSETGQVELEDIDVSFPQSLTSFWSSYISRL